MECGKLTIGCCDCSFIWLGDWTIDCCCWTTWICCCCGCCCQRKGEQSVSDGRAKGEQNVAVPKPWVPPLNGLIFRTYLLLLVNLLLLLLLLRLLLQLRMLLLLLGMMWLWRWRQLGRCGQLWMLLLLGLLGLLKVVDDSILCWSRLKLCWQRQQELTCCCVGDGWGTAAGAGLAADDAGGWTRGDTTAPEFNDFLPRALCSNRREKRDISLVEFVEFGSSKSYPIVNEWNAMKLENLRYHSAVHASNGMDYALGTQTHTKCHRIALSNE